MFDSLGCFIYLTAYQFLMGYLLPKFDPFVKVDSNNCLIIFYYTLLSVIIYLHTLVLFQVFLSNTNNL